MGEIADDMIDGTTCSLCGMYFVDGTDEEGNPRLYEHGYPAVCWRCWKTLSKRERANYQKALKPTL